MDWGRRREERKPLELFEEVLQLFGRGGGE